MTPNKTVAPSISDAAVQAKTGKAWAEWFTLLDKAGAKKLDHKGIVKILHEQFSVGSWWQQMVTVEYERSRGLRAVHETSVGFVASISRTFPVSAEQMFAAWQDSRRRGRWLALTGVVVRSSTPSKVMRLTWSDGVGNVEARFTAKGSSKCQVAIQHSKLTSAKAVAETKAIWKAALDRLRESLI